MLDTDETVWDEIYSTSTKARHTIDAQDTLVNQPPPVFPTICLARCKEAERAIKFCDTIGRMLTASLLLRETMAIVSEALKDIEEWLKTVEITKKTRNKLMSDWLEQ